MEESASDPGRQVIVRAFDIAAETGELCRPIHVLTALKDIRSPVSGSLASPLGRPFLSRPDSPPPRRGGRASFLVMQTQQAAGRLASERGETTNPAHLLLAVVDQGDPEAHAALHRAGLDLAAIRRVALEALGAPADFPPISVPSFTPAGTADRPPLPIEELDPRAWSALCWREDHLPLHRVKRRDHYDALCRLESRAVWRVASEFELDDDQGYSLLRHHLDQIEERTARALPECVAVRSAESPVRFKTTMTTHRRGRRRFGWLTPTVGWGNWFGNRRVGLRNRWFHLRTLRHFRHAPQQ